MSNNPENKNDMSFLDDVRREIEAIQAEDRSAAKPDTDTGAKQKKPADKPERGGKEHKNAGKHSEKKPAAKPEPEEKPAKKVKQVKPAPKDSAPEKKPLPEKNTKKKGGWKLPVILVASVLALLGIGALIGGTVVSRTDTIFPNVFVEGTNVGELTVEEAARQLEIMGWDEGEASELTVTLPAKIQFTVDMYESGAKLTPQGAAEAAFRYGHSGSIFDSLYKYLRCLMIPVDMGDIHSRLDTEYVMEKIDGGIQAFTEKVTGIPYEVDTESKSVRLFKGADKLKLDADDIFKSVQSALENEQAELEYIQPAAIVTMPNMEKIREQVYCEPRDSVYDPETQGATKEQVGVDFDVEQAKRIWNEAQLGEEISIPLTITEPRITAEELSAMLFRDKLGSQSTYYYGSTSDRINNIKLAASKLNDLVLNPGDVLSYNDAVGERTEENGFRYAAAYDNGKVVQQIGGGICQVSSTLYCASMLAQMETVARTCHYFPVGYLPVGLDATVSWGAPDFKFRNCRDYPVKIVAYCEENSRRLTIEIWGTDVDGTYVELVSGSEPIYHPEYPDVAIGYYAYSYRNIYDKDGNFLDHVYEAASEYHYHDEDIVLPEKEEGEGGEGEGGESGGGEGETEPTPTPDPIGDEPDPEE